jgi:hypothetical protein
MENEKVNYPQFKQCKNWGAGLCAGTGCVAQALMNNSADLGEGVEAEERRAKIKKDAKANGCGALPLQEPKFGK